MNKILTNIIRIGGYIIFFCLLVAVFSDSTVAGTGKPITLNMVGTAMGLSLGMIAIGCLGDIIEALSELKQDKSPK